MFRRIDPEKHVYEVYRKDTPDERRIVNRVHLRIKPRRPKAVTPSYRDHADGKDTTTPVRDCAGCDGSCEDSSDSSSDDEFLMMDDSVVSVPSPARPRRSTRVTAGKHSNIHHLPKSTVHY